MCGLAPPNLATLSVMAQFGAYRQPSLYRTNSFKDSYKKLIEGKCVAAVLRDVMIKKFDSKNLTKTIFKTRALPNQAFSVGTRIKKNEVKIKWKYLKSLASRLLMTEREKDAFDFLMLGAPLDRRRLENVFGNSRTSRIQDFIDVGLLIKTEDSKIRMNGLSLASLTLPNFRSKLIFA